MAAVVTHAKDPVRAGWALCGYVGKDLQFSDDDPACCKCYNRVARQAREEEYARKERAMGEREKKRDAYVGAAFKKDWRAIDADETAAGPLRIDGHDVIDLLTTAKMRVEMAHNELKDHVGRLASDMTELAKKLDHLGYSAAVNSIGEVQDQGHEVDRLCSEFHSAQHEYMRLVRFVARARGVDGFVEEP